MIHSAKGEKIMLNTESIDAIKSLHWGPGFSLPMYGSFCFSGIPGSIFNILCKDNHPELTSLPISCLPDDCEDIERIIFILIDGLGWDRVFPCIGRKKKYSLPGIRYFADYGKISALTCQFPSTTVVHSVTLGSALMPGQAGNIEWNYYEPRIGRIITPFLMNYASDDAYGNIKKDGYSAVDIFPEGHFIKLLNENKIKTYIYSSKDFTPSDFSDRVFKGAEIIPIHSIASGFAHLRRNLYNINKSFHFIYINSYDAIGHNYGVSSPFAYYELESILLMIQYFILERRREYPENTLLILSSDHGMVNIDPQSPIYINLVYPEIVNYMKKGIDKKVLSGAGSSGRSIMLNILPELKDHVLNKLRKVLDGHASVFSHEEMLSMDLYGTGNLRDDLSERAGDIVILAHKNSTIGWYEKDVFSVELNANHGGLTIEEMEIPFCSICLD